MASQDGDPFASSPVPEELDMPLYANGYYDNPWDTWEHPRGWKIMKWVATKKTYPPNPQAQIDELLPIATPELDVLRNPDPAEVVVTWIGHATLLVQMEGVTFLTDPVWSERCFPVQWAGPKRFRPVPCKITDLPRIDFVILSHNHYDHLDQQTVKDLRQHCNPQWFVPAGMAGWFKSLNVNAVELSWWQETKFGNSITLISLPCQHWSKRSTFRRNDTLWCSWGVIGPTKRAFFAGDTGYCRAFKQIGNKYGPFDLAMIPIGAYEPRELMKPQHVNPEEAVQIHLDIKAQYSVGMHWGTFYLTDEDIYEPPKKIMAELQRRNLPPDTFFTLRHGETKRLKKVEEASKQA